MADEPKTTPAETVFLRALSVHRPGGKALEDRFWGKVDKQGFCPGACWVWLSAIDKGGYGDFWVGFRKTQSAHVVAYWLLVGFYSRDLELDHMCRNRACVNPDHLQPVTPLVNMLRGESFAAVNSTKDRCPKGHPYENNLVTRADGHRQCRICHNESCRAAKRRMRLKGEVECLTNKQ